MGKTYFDGVLGGKARRVVDYDPGAYPIGFEAEQAAERVAAKRSFRKIFG